MLRELAWIELDMEPEPDPDQTQLMTDEEFDHEVEVAGRGGWEELDLDPLPADWKPATIEDLRNAR